MRVKEGWAYPFDVQTKTFYYPRTTPNIISTVFAGNAFLDAVEAGWDESAYSEVVDDTARFLVSEFISEKDEMFIKYLPDKHRLIHNANALGAQFLVRAGLIVGDESLTELGLKVLEPTIAAIREDGSILYGREADLAWVDNHHTGFVIDALWEINRVLNDRPYEAEVVRLAGYYERHLFGKDGRPLPRPNKRWPLDVIGGAQGIQTFAKLGGPYFEKAVAVAAFMEKNFYSRKGTFLYQKGRVHSKRVPYARWCDAPMCLALAVLSVAEDSVIAAA